MAFENPRALGAFKKVPDGESSVASEPQLASSKYDVPDRLTGLRTWEELKNLVPERKWNFIEVDVPYDEFLKEKENIEALMHPCDSVVSSFCTFASDLLRIRTDRLAIAPLFPFALSSDSLFELFKMDLSIAAALWFASRGIGCIAGGDGQLYRTPAPVLLSGLGADELLGGYARHRGAFERAGIPALVREVSYISLLTFTSSLCFSDAFSLLTSINLATLSVSSNLNYTFSASTRSR